MPDGTPDDARDLANNVYLLGLLRGRAPDERAARYVCVVVLDEGGSAPLALRGEAAGAIASGFAGTGGFGYDPIFLDPATGKTFAELSEDEKNARSHRGSAFRQLGEVLRRRLEP